MPRADCRCIETVGFYKFRRDAGRVAMINEDVCFVRSFCSHRPYMTDCAKMVLAATEDALIVSRS